MAVEREEFQDSFFDEEPSEKLTEWENEPTVQDLHKDYQEASSHHSSQVARIDKWLDNLYVTGAAKIKKVRGRSTMVPKLIRKQAEWRYASLSEPFLGDEDLFQTEPVTYEDKDAAIQNGLVLNHQFNNLIDKTSFVDQYVRSAVDEGTVIVRVGWDFEEEEIEVEVPVMELRPILDPQQASMLLQQGLPPVEQVQTGTEIQVVPRTIRNQPTVEVCSYKHVIIDPTCNGNMAKANFVIFLFETSLSELEKLGRYHNLEHINVERNSILTEGESEKGDPNSDGGSFNFSDKPRKKFWAYEYWGYWDIDGSGKTKPIVATWVGDVMIRMEESPFPDGGLPFVVVSYLPKRFSVYGEPDGELLEDNQKILGAVTRGVIDMMGRSAAGQMATRIDALDVTNQRKFDMGLDYQFSAHVDPRQAFYMHEYPDIPQSAQFMIQLQNADAESLVGVKAFGTGLTGDSLGTTATGVRGALDAASKRELGILRRLATGMIQIGRKVMAMNSIFLSDEEIIRITNEEFVTVKRDDLAGKVDIKLQISTAETDNAKAQELAFMLQTMGNSMPFEMSQMILADIARLRKMPDLSKAIKAYERKPDPMEQEKLQMEVALLRAQIAKTESEAMENQAQAGLDQAKTRQTQSQADMQDLDFVEQESGVTQERDLEKQRAQAESNTRMKIVEGALKNLTEREKAIIAGRMKLAQQAAKPNGSAAA